MHSHPQSGTIITAISAILLSLSLSVFFIPPDAIAQTSEQGAVHDSAWLADVNQLARAQSPGLAGNTDTSRERLTRALRQPQRNLMTDILKVIFGLVVTIVLVFVAAWGIKKLGLAGTSKIGGGGSMDLLEVLPLGQNRALMLIRVMDKVHLIGQTPNGIENLETFEGEKALQLISASKGGSTMVQFKDVFNQFINRMRKS